MRTLGRNAIVSSVIFGILFTLPGLLPGMSAATAEAQSPQQTLNRYVADLQKTPNDYALREKIIRHVQTMKPAPAVPIEAEKFEGRAEFAIKSAKTEADFLDAAKEYEKALLIAPWVPAYYFNQGIAFEKSGKLKEAKRSLEFYLLAAPNAQDARDVRKRIAGLEYAMEKAAKEPPRQVSTAPKQNPFEDLLRKIDGRRYTSPVDNTNHFIAIDVTGKVFRLGILYPQNYDVPSRRGQFVEDVRDEIRGRETTVPVERGANPFRFWPVSRTYVISDDGDRITYRVRYNDGDVRQYILLWQR